MGAQFQYKQGNFNQGNSSQGWKNHPSIGQQQSNTSGQVGGFRQQQPSPLWQQVSSLTETVRDLSGRFDKFLKVYESQQASDQASFRALEAQIGHLSKRVETTEKSQSRGNTDVSPKDECNVVMTNRKRKTVEEIIEIGSSEDEDEKSMYHYEENEQKKHEEEKEKEKGVYQEPFREIFDRVTIIPGACPQIPEYDKRIKYYLGEVIDLDDEEDQDRLVKPRKKDHPQKLKDSGALTLPCVINDVDIGRAIIDSGSSVNLMPFIAFKKIGGMKLKPANITLTITDGSIKKSVGIVEDAIVRIDALEFLLDFLVVDMANEGRISLISGRPFMRISKMVVRIHDSNIKLRDHDQMLIYYGSEETKMRAIRRSKYKKARRKAAKEENTLGIEHRNNCNVLHILEEKKASVEESIPSEDTIFLHGMSVRFKIRKWIVNRKLKEEGMIEIRRPYSTTIRKVERRKLSKWDDEDPDG
ncbi:uncharacterized protein LOC106779351 [Vigna radiata var. radiata]|uniref:Uncharacterized protein LOC106779351 n=1 Tax=Vigna radiata var. radiata TaxID=3916 RepID=A0A1S3VX92_VIGRR|nr:uncharacterized protein LOC106779351 [Vigna radiata var. radiata]